MVLRIGFVFLLAMAAPALAKHPDRKVQLEWSKIDPLVRSKQVKILTTTGQWESGKVHAVTASAITVDSRRVAREQVVSVQFDERRGPWRLIATATGLYIPGAIVNGVGGKYAGENPAIGLAILGTGVLGYFVGREIDRQTVIIEILPEPLRKTP